MRRQAAVVASLSGLPVRLVKGGLHLGVRRWAVLLAVLAIGVGLPQLLDGSYFKVTAAKVRGCQRIPAEAVYAASGLHGQSVFRIRPDEAATRLAALPGVAAAAVHVRLPHHVRIEVREYLPLVSWQVFTTTVWLGDDGTPIPMVGDPPALTLVDAGGAAMDSSGGLRPEVLADLKALRAARPELTHVYYGEQEGLYFRASAGWTVYLGVRGEIGEKLALLEATERDLLARSEHVDVIDLRFEGHALVW
jgi:cell division septal protein FtsQ